MAGLMVDPLRAAPSGWTGYPTARDMEDDLPSVDVCAITGLAVRGDLDECTAVLALAERILNAQFHLMNGMTALEAVYFHAPDLDEAVACHSAMTSRRRGGLTGDMELELTTDVPLGGQATWRRALSTIDIERTHIPESLRIDLLDGPATRLVESPMLPEDLVITGFTDRASGQTIHLTTKKD